jgi:uncharacterized membrane protein YraQ (UPF0718 family)
MCSSTTHELEPERQKGRRKNDGNPQGLRCSSQAKIGGESKRERVQQALFSFISSHRHSSKKNERETRMQIIDSLGQALFTAFSMLWEILWPLVLGFALSGVVQAVVSHQSMAKALGGDSPKNPRIAQRDVTGSQPA